MRFDLSKYLHKKYNRLLVVGAVKVPVRDGPGGGYDKSYLRCVCDCGREVVVAPHTLTHGTTKSCGCAKKDHVRGLAYSRVVHGQAKRAEDSEGHTPIYESWRKIRNLCARGLRIGFHKTCHEYDPRWEDFEAFYRDFGPIEAGQTIRRLDRKMPWGKENCYIGQGQCRRP